MTDSNGTTGEIHNSRDEVYAEWKIKDYLSLPQKTDNYVTSPNFHFLNASWCLRIYPNGNRLDKSVEFMSFYIKRNSSAEKKFPINFSLGIKNGNSQVYAEKSATYLFCNSTDVGWHKFIHRNTLLRNMSKVAPEGTLTVFFKLLWRQNRAVETASAVETESQTVTSDGFLALSREFESLLCSGRQSDVTIKVKQRLFRVHKLILGTRSPVFSAMFEHNMKENSSGVVNIGDCEPDVFHDFLVFLYAGKVKNLSSGNVASLFTLADKYVLEDLKSICLDFMKDNLCLNNVCEVVSVADRHDEVELKKSATELIKKNIKTILTTEKWILFMAENSVLAAEILMTIIPENK